MSELQDLGYGPAGSPVPINCLVCVVGSLEPRLLLIGRMSADIPFGRLKIFRCLTRTRAARFIPRACSHILFIENVREARMGAKKQKYLLRAGEIKKMQKKFSHPWNPASEMTGYQLAHVAN